jgi:hypothetical protein
MPPIRLLRCIPPEDFLRDTPIHCYIFYSCSSSVAASPPLTSCSHFFTHSALYLSPTHSIQLVPILSVLHLFLLSNFDTNSFNPRPFFTAPCFFIWNPLQYSRPILLYSLSILSMFQPLFIHSLLFVRILFSLHSLHSQRPFSSLTRTLTLLFY